jgi:hypothetical protein
MPLIFIQSTTYIFSRPGIVLGYGLDGHGIGVQFPAATKMAGSEADHLSPSSAEAKNIWIYTSIHLLIMAPKSFYYFSISN